MRSAADFNKDKGILAGPKLLFSKEVKISRTFSSPIWAIISSNWLRFFKYAVWDLLGTFGTVYSVSKQRRNPQYSLRRLCGQIFTEEQ